MSRRVAVDRRLTRSNFGSSCIVSNSEVMAELALGPVNRVTFHVGAGTFPLGFMKAGRRFWRDALSSFP
jgi:hypothetical protein